MGSAIELLNRHVESALTTPGLEFICRTIMMALGSKSVLNSWIATYSNNLLASCTSISLGQIPTPFVSISDDAEGKEVNITLEYNTLYSSFWPPESKFDYYENGIKAISNAIEGIIGYKLNIAVSLVDRSKQATLIFPRKQNAPQTPTETRQTKYDFSYDW